MKKSETYLFGFGFFMCKKKTLGLSLVINLTTTHL